MHKSILTDQLFCPATDLVFRFNHKTICKFLYLFDGFVCVTAREYGCL